MLWLSIVLDVIALGSGLMEFSLLREMQEGTLPPEEMVAAAEASDLRQRIIGLTQTALIVATVIVFARWIYILNDNKRRLGASGLGVTPGWAVGCFFVPIANLLIPYLATKELWQVSANPQQWQNQRSSALVPWWWFFWLANCIIGQISFHLSLRATTLPELTAANITTQFADAVSIAVEFLALALVSRIAGMQAGHGPAPART
jgi:hypothetical protein